MTMRHSVYRLLSAAGSLINFMEPRKERYFDPTTRAHRVGVFPTTVSSYCSTFVPARDRWIAVIQPSDTTTGYSLVHVPNPDSISILAYCKLRSRFVCDSENHISSYCSVKYREIINLKKIQIMSTGDT